MMLPYASSSSTAVSQGYDVFMSFRGEDTRMGFTSHLYDALTRNDIRTYKDDKTLEIGRPIASELLEAIEASRIAIVVLSSSFATSKWCLEEIAKIVDCMKRGKLIVIPIFYHVSPSDVRRQSNSFEQGFANHEVNPEIAPQEVETWRAAFKEVGVVSGLHVTEHRVEAEVVNEIVSIVLRDLPDTMPIDLPNSLVGIRSRVDEVKRLLRMESSEVLFIGICGMSGIGKTTIAEAVYKDIKSKFEKSSLIENIKDISKQNDSNDLRKLQQKLLDDILIGKSIRVQSVTDGQTSLSKKLRDLKVIIVLDDVNHVDQLTYLAGGREWFGPGSRIIVTTTNRDLLNTYKINEIYLCEEMKRNEALSLFCRSAFERSYPPDGYEKLSNDIVKLAGGLPLALNVYGSLLCGKEGSYWKDMLKKLKQYPDEEVLGRLEVVYARLDKNQRYVFIYVACFLRGRNIDFVKDILSNIGLSPECGITDFINKCLITINLDDSVWMHDLLQQMCWKVLCGESYRPKQIAIKYHEDIVDALSSNPKGTHTVEVINQEPYKGEVNDCIIDPTCFSKMTKLKFLRISNVHFPEGLSYLSSDIRLLEWYACSLKSMPSTFEPKHIYELEVCSSQLKTLWKKDLELPNLRSINLSFSKDLTDIPNLTSASNLVKLNLEGCTSLKILHESVLLHKRLRYLNLKGCTCLQSLGRSRMEMEGLEALLLSGCSKLENIPEFGKNMKRLEHLYVDGTRIKNLPENLGELCDLRNLDASRTFIEELPSSISRLKKLRLMRLNSCRLSFKMGCFLNPSLDALSSGLKEVDLSYCNLFVVPDDIGLLCHLITLNLSGNEFVSLPASIGLLSKLRMLSLNDCKRLQSLPKLSLVDEDMDYGPRSRFHYYVSTKEVDVSKFDALSFNHRPTVLCLYCPNLAVDKRGRNLAEKVLNCYLELRTKYWMTPEAVFEIVGAGSEISSGFVDPGYRGLPLKGPWIGVAICAVVSAHHVDCYKEANHMVTAHIRLGGKHWKIPVAINFLVAESETQIILYWTTADGPLRIACSSHWGVFDVSFDLEPDSNLEVTKVGVRFIREEYINCLKQPADSKIKVGESIHKYINFKYEPYVDACKDDTNLQHHTIKIVNFIFHYGSQHDSLVGIYQITKGLLEINQEFLRILSAYEREWRDEKNVYCYYAINLGVSVLYKDFVQSLKIINDGWLSVKSALQQIVVKSRADNYSYEEMKQHLNDLEATHSVEFSDNFISMFLSVCRRTFDFLCSITIKPSKPQEDTSLRMLPNDVLMLPKAVLRRMLQEAVLRRMLRDDVLPRTLPEDVLRRMLPEDALPRALSEDVLPRMLSEDVLRIMLPEDVLRRMLPEDVLPRMLSEDVLPRMLQEDVLRRMLPEHVFPTTLPEDVLRRRLPEDVLRRMLPEDALQMVPMDVLPEDVLLSMLLKYVLPRMLPKDVLPMMLQEDGLLRMFLEDVLPRMLLEDVLPRMLPKDVLPRMPQEDVIQRMLQEDVVLRILQEDVLPRILREDVLQRMLQNDVLPRIVRKHVLPRMLQEDVLSIMFRVELAKISSIPIACVICMMTVFMGDFEHQNEMKDTTWNDLWQHLLSAFTRMKDCFTEDGWFMMKPHYNCHLQIFEFSENGILLQQLMNKMGRSDCFTKEIKEEMMSVIDKLQNNIHKVSSTVQEMSSHADQYCHDIGKVRKHVTSFSTLSKDDNIISMLPLFNKN